MSTTEAVSGPVVTSTRWFFRGYTVLAVAAAAYAISGDGLTDAHPIPVLAGLLSAVLGLRLSGNAVCDRETPFSASCFAWFHTGLALCVFLIAVNAFDTFFGHETAVAHLVEMAFAFTLAALLLSTVRRAISFALSRSGGGVVGGGCEGQDGDEQGTQR